MCVRQCLKNMSIHSFYLIFLDHSSAVSFFDIIRVTLRKEDEIMAEKKLLSPPVVYLLGINSIIGSGIFLLSGKIYRDAGTWSLLAILLAGLSIFIIAFSYANMSKLYPENGGAFIYAKAVFGRFAGFIVGMVTWLLGTVTMATEVSALLTAIKMISPNINTRMIGVIILVILGIISCFGSAIISVLDNVTSLIKVLIVIIFIVTTIWLVKIANFNFLPLAPHSLSTGLTGFLSAYGTVFFFFTGFSFLPVNAEKMKNPAKNLPKIMSLVMVTCIVIYVIIQGITIGVLGHHLPDTIVPAATIFSEVVGAIGIPLFVISVCWSIFGVIVATAFNTPTILSSLALDHEDVPLLVARKNRFGSPVLAVMLTTVVGVFLFLTGNYVFLSGLTVFMSFVQYLSTGLANIKAKYRWIGLGTVLFSLILLASFTPRVLLFGVSFILILSVIYLFVKVDDAHLDKIKQQKKILKERHV